MVEARIPLAMGSAKYHPWKPDVWNTIVGGKISPHSRGKAAFTIASRRQHGRKQGYRVAGGVQSGSSPQTGRFDSC